MYGLGWREIVPPQRSDGTANADPSATRHWGVANADPPRVPWVCESVIVSDLAIAGRGMFTNQALEGSCSKRRALLAALIQRHAVPQITPVREV